MLLQLRTQSLRSPNKAARERERGGGGRREGAALISDRACTHLGEWQHDEGAAAAGVHDHGYELGVDGAEVAVPGHLGDAHVVVALVGLERLAKDVAELAGAHDAPRHGGLKFEPIKRQEVDRKSGTEKTMQTTM